MTGWQQGDRVISTPYDAMPIEVRGLVLPDHGHPVPRHPPPSGHQRGWLPAQAAGEEEAPMSNSRRFRRGLAASRQARAAGMIRPGAWKDKGRAPTLGTVRKWMHAAEAEGVIERVGVRHTGKPGRPADLWGITEAGRARGER